MSLFKGWAGFTGGRWPGCVGSAVLQIHLCQKKEEALVFLSTTRAFVALSCCGCKAWCYTKLHMTAGLFEKQSVARPELNTQVGFVYWLACSFFTRACLSIRNILNIWEPEWLCLLGALLYFYDGCNNSELGLINESIKQQQHFKLCTWPYPTEVIKIVWVLCFVVQNDMNEGAEFLPKP